MSHRTYIERLLITILIIALVLLLWRLRSVVVLVFTALLVAVIFTSLTAIIRDRLPAARRVALPITVLLVLGIVIGSIALFGAEVASQAQQIGDMLPRAWQSLQVYAESWGLGEQLEGAVSQLGGGAAIGQWFGGLAMSLGAGIADAVLVVVGGIYFAAQPELYRTGVIKLTPERARGLAATALDDTARALRLWLGGQFVSMTIIGLLTYVGLWLLGVPSAMALALMAGLLEFVPYIGPILAAVPAVLLALTVSPELALWTAGLYTLLQQIEGNIVYPIVQQRAVDMPPALLLFTIVACGLLFGMAGIIIAAPLAVVLFVLVKRLYVREALHTKTAMPGDSP